jgi:hypothetical protein
MPERPKPKKGVPKIRITPRKHIGMGEKLEASLGRRMHVKDLAKEVRMKPEELISEAPKTGFIDVDERSIARLNRAKWLPIKAKGPLAHTDRIHASLDILGEKRAKPEEIGGITNLSTNEVIAAGGGMQGLYYDGRRNVDCAVGLRPSSSNSHFLIGHGLSFGYL